LKLKSDEPLSNLAFNFNVRRYSEARRYRTLFRTSLAFTAPCFLINMVLSHVAFLGWMYTGSIMVGRCRMKPIEPLVESAWFQRLKLTCDTPLSKFALNFNLRHYIMGVSIASFLKWGLATPVQFVVGARFHIGAYKSLRNGVANMVGRWADGQSKPDVKTRCQNPMDSQNPS
jgi:Cu+-exporting ATPase